MRALLAERSISNSLTGVYQRLLDAHWFYAGIGQLAQEDEFGLDLRVLGGAAYGRFLTRTNEQELALAAGVAAAREYLRDDSVEDGVEGLLLAKYALFHYDEPETSLTASVFVLPSLSELGAGQNRQLGAFASRDRARSIHRIEHIPRLRQRAAVGRRAEQRLECRDLSRLQLLAREGT